MSPWIQVPHPIEILHSGEVAMACGLDGQILADELHGLFAGDTRVLSTYRISIGGQLWKPLGRARTGQATASWELQNVKIRSAVEEIPAGTLLLGIKRRIDGGLHDDIRVISFHTEPLGVRLTFQIDSDFSDIFEVKKQSIHPRLDIIRRALGNRLSFLYERRGFRRALHVEFQCEAPITSVGSLIVFDLHLEPKKEWSCCVEAIPEISGKRKSFSRHPHGPERRLMPEAGEPEIAANPLLADPATQGRRDLRALSVPQGDQPPFVAAGAPWFLTLFGRDPLMASLMSSIDGTWSARGALSALERLQADERDDWRDAEPGKIPHELREGELTFRRIVPHSPYYGTHDAPALYCLTLWNAWRWTGDRALLDKHFNAAEAALDWCENLGDRDGDGFLEYETRSPVGYKNQSWKDASDAIVHVDGAQAAPPLATLELQGYWFAALLAMSELYGERDQKENADRCREKASALRERVLERFWMPEENFFALALDGKKKLVRAISSNPGHLLWCGLPSRGQAEKLAKRLLEPDLFSGWGLRTLSSTNGAYNPLSYQRGSVWPHDTMLAAAGLMRYGLRPAAEKLIHAILEAASAFENKRLPELFCGLDRSNGLPVPYAEANSPQAWAAAAPLLGVQLFLGIVPHASKNRCIIDPWLPEWLPELSVTGIRIGDRKLSVKIRREGDQAKIAELDSGGLEISDQPGPAPLWGAPMGAGDSEKTQAA